MTQPQAGPERMPGASPSPLPEQIVRYAAGRGRRAAGPARLLHRPATAIADPHRADPCIAAAHVQRVLVLIPLALPSGRTTPRESMPLPVRDLTLLAPATHFVELGRGILYRAGSDVVRRPFLDRGDRHGAVRAVAAAFPQDPESDGMNPALHFATTRFVAFSSRADRRSRRCA